MTELKELTPEQEALMLVVRDEYIEKIDTYVEPDLDKVTEWVGWLYSLANLDPPEVVVVGTTEDAKVLTDRIMDASSDQQDKLHLCLARDMSAAQSGVYAPVRHTVWEVITKPIKEKMRTLPGKAPSYYSKMGWLALHEFYTRVGVLNSNNFNKFKECCDLGIYENYQYEGLCVVVKQPLSIKKAHEEKLEKLQLANDLLAADKLLGDFIQKHTGGS